MPHLPISRSNAVLSIDVQQGPNAIVNAQQAIACLQWYLIAYAGAKAAKTPKKIPDGLWVKCPSCHKSVFKRLVEERLDTCPECGHHFPMTAQRRVDMLIDEDTWKEWDPKVSSGDPLKFVDSQKYPDRIAAAKKKTGMQDAVLTGSGKLDGRSIGLGVMDFRFNGGSMGSAVGERLTRLIEVSTEENLPVIIVSASGGARMQEGILSLMQMAKNQRCITTS